MSLLHLAATSSAPILTKRPLVSPLGPNPHPPVPSSKDVPSPDVLRRPVTDPATPVIFFTHLWLPPPGMYLRYAAAAPLPEVTPWVATSSCSPCLRDAPISRCPLHIQYVLCAHRCVPHSLVANSHKCHRYLSVVPPAQTLPQVQLWFAPPIRSYPTPQMCILVLDMAPGLQMGFITPDAPPRPDAPPHRVQPLPARFCLPKPSQPLLPRALPSPPSHPAVPLPSPRCAPFQPLPTHLPAPERRPPPTMLRAGARPGPCSRDAPRGLPPLFPPCHAQRLALNLLSPSVTSRTHSYTRPPRARESAGRFPSCSAGGLTPLHPFS